MSYQRDYGKKVRVAVIGIGSHCYRNILPTMTWLPVELVAVCDINEKLAQETGKQYGCRYYTDSRRMYEEETQLDAVFICVGPQYHPDLIMEALTMKKHVWVEKPVSVRASKVKEMMEMEGDRVVVVGLKKMFTPAARKAKEIVYSNAYGHLNSVLAVYHMDIPQDGDAVLEEGAVPNWLRNGVHPLSFMIGIAGEVDEIQALTNEMGYGVVALRFKNGIFGNLHLASGPQPDVERYSLFGKNWEMDIQNASIALRRGIEDFDYKKTTEYTSPVDQGGTVVWNIENCVATLENKAEFVQGIYSEMKYFCDCILENRKPETGTLKQAFEIMKIYEAVLKSKGLPVKIED